MSFMGNAQKLTFLRQMEKLAYNHYYLLTHIHITEDNFEKVPRVYIETLKDNAISIMCQREMYTRTPCRQIITLDTDHSPFFSQPEVLSSHLKKLSVSRV